MSFEMVSSNIPGCYELIPKVIKDNRGVFVKTFHQDYFRDHGLITHFAEEYYSLSYRGVLRGMHFQTPPMALTKLVYCLFGEVMDVVIDLRYGSPTYGKFAIFELSAEKANIIYIPVGLAHGFYVKSQSALMMYKVTEIYSPEHDTGIRWNSVGISWPDNNPIISKRDSEFVPFESFKSDFSYEGSLDEKQS